MLIEKVVEGMILNIKSGLKKSFGIILPSITPEPKKTRKANSN